MILCPKCGNAQDAVGECIKCGVVFSKYMKKLTSNPDMSSSKAPLQGVYRPASWPYIPSQKTRKAFPIPVAVSIGVLLLGLTAGTLLYL